MTHSLTVSAAGDWFLIDDHRVELSVRRSALRAILIELARNHPEPISTEDLVRAGWPGEQLPGTSAQNRLHVAIHSLRGLGLEDVLIKTPGGYAIDPSIEVSGPTRTTAGKSSADP